MMTNASEIEAMKAEADVEPVACGHRHSREAGERPRGCPAVAAGYTGNMYAPDPQCWMEVD